MLMAVSVVWVQPRTSSNGAGSRLARVVTWTIGSTAVGHTFVATSPNGSVATYIAITSDTTATIATGLAAACEAVTDGQFTELMFEADDTECR